MNYKDCHVMVKCGNGHIATWTYFNQPTDPQLREKRIQEKIKKSPLPCSTCWLEHGSSYEENHKIKLLNIS